LVLEPLLVLLLLVPVALHLGDHPLDLRVLQESHAQDHLVVEPDARTLEGEPLVQQIDYPPDVLLGQLPHRVAPSDLPTDAPDPALVAAFQSSVGTWRCAGTMMLPPDMGGQQVKTRSQMIIRREVSGFAYSGDYRMEGSKDFPGVHGRILWTYDPAAKKFYELSVDDSGSAVRGES